MSGSFAFTGPARCGADYQQACARFGRGVRYRVPTRAPGLRFPQLECLQEEPCRVPASMPMPGTRAAGPGLRAVINRCCDVAATRQADPADNRAEQGTRALFAHYLESRSMFAGSSPALTPCTCR